MAVPFLDRMMQNRNPMRRRLRKQLAGAVESGTKGSKGSAVPVSKSFSKPVWRMVLGTKKFRTFAAAS
jgi:hypothetical protein